MKWNAIVSIDVAQSCIAKDCPLSPSRNPPEALASTWKKLVARVDVPLLDSRSITFFNQLTFDIPQLLQFQSRRKAKVTQLGRAGIERLGPRDNPRAASLLRILVANQPTSDWAGFIDGASMRFGLTSHVEEICIREILLSKPEW